MRAWTIDAAKILQSKPKPALEFKEVISTNKIRMFLERDDLNFVVAPKGFGKTLLLIAKRLQFHKKEKGGFTLIPSHGLLVDVPKGGAANLEWSRGTINFFTDRRNWEGIWRVCLSLSIVRALKNANISLDAEGLVSKLSEHDETKRTEQFEHLQRLLAYDTLDTPLDFLNCILSTFSKKELRGILRELEYLDQIIARVHTPIAIFIDNVDEYFEEHLEKGRGSYSPAIRGVFDTQMWGLSQRGLMFAVKTMCRNNHHLDIYTSIRKEAYAELNATTLENLRGSCLDDLQYSKLKLQEILVENIRKTPHEFLFDITQLDSAPLRALCGLDRLHHDLVDRNEGLFDYIYRHTLKRPRDIIRIGREIAMSDREERTPTRIKEIINSVATHTARDYIKLSLPHTDFEREDDFLAFLQLIPHNILTYESLRMICSCVNGGCNNLACDSCVGIHPFCDLYRLGLLGIVKYYRPIRQHHQRFLAPGEKSLGHRRILPINRSLDSGFYIIHPLLNELIGGDPHVRINGSIVIGDREPWSTPLLPKSIQKYRLFLSYSRMDALFASRLVDDLRRKGIPIWRDQENIQIGESFLERVKKGIEECEYFGVVVSQSGIESGWVAAEIKLAMQYEIERMKVRILPILIDSVWDQAPAVIRQRQFVDFRDDYDPAFDALRKRLMEGR